MSLRQKAIRGTFWSAIDRWGSQLINFLIVALLAHLLEPEDFGLVALASVFTSFIQLFLDQGMGMGRALIQRSNLEREHLDTAFWTNVLGGGLLTLLGILGSRPISAFFDEPRLTPIVAWLSPNFILFALRSTQQSILERRLDFRSLTLRSILASIGGGTAGVATALFGFGVWSLVVQALARNLIDTAVLWRLSDWEPSFHFSIRHLKELSGFGLNIMGIQVLNFLDIRLDDLLIGYFLGSIALGYYTIAYRLLLSMLNLLTGVITAVALPTFSRLQDKLERLQDAFGQATELAAFVIWPAFLGILVLSPELVAGVFGEKWLPSVPVMQVLAIAGLMISVLGFANRLTIALGRPRLLLGIKLIITFARVCAFAIAAQKGIVAVAIAFAMTTYMVYTPLYLWLINHLIQIGIGNYLRIHIVPLASSLAMIVVILGLKLGFSGLIAIYWQLVIYVITGMLVYIAGIYFLKPMLLQQLRDLVRLALPNLEPNSILK